MKICYIGNNVPRENWGCRATSMALFDLISADHEIESTIFGDRTYEYNARQYMGNLPGVTYYDRALNFFGRNTYKSKLDKADFIRQNPYESLKQFLAVFPHYKPLTSLYEKIYNADAVVINGEGTAIYTSTPRERYEFKFFLFALVLAQCLGKRTYYLNSVFSDSIDVRNENLLNVSRRVFQKCTAVHARDPLSYNYYQINIGNNATYVPDALFSWYPLVNQYKNVARDYPLVGMTFPEYKDKWYSYKIPQDYICLSGSSLSAHEPSLAVDGYIRLAEELRKYWNVIIVPTCGGDFFLSEVANRTGLPYIDVRSNILYGASLLGNAKVFVSGRWHPSILASMGGTPCVLMNSNSHKTAAIQSMLGYNRIHEYDSLNINNNTILNIVNDTKTAIEQGATLRQNIQLQCLNYSEQCCNEIRNSLT